MQPSEREKLQEELKQVSVEIRNVDAQVRQHKMWLKNLEEFLEQKRKRRDEILAMK